MKMNNLAEKYKPIFRNANYDRKRNSTKAHTKNLELQLKHPLRFKYKYGHLQMIVFAQEDFEYELKGSTGRGLVCTCMTNRRPEG